MAIFSKSAVLVLLSAAIVYGEVVAASSRFITSVTPVAAPTCFECSDHTCHSVPETKAGQCLRHTYATRAQCEMGCKPIPTYRCVTASGRSGCQLAPNGTGGGQGDVQASPTATATTTRTAVSAAATNA